MSDHDDVDRAGVGLVQYIAGRHKLIYREQTTSDYGVDGHFELRKADGSASGRLVGAQLKSGKSWFDEPSDKGWIFRPKKRHIRYWFGHSLPMYVLLADVEAGEVYWEQVSKRTLQTGPKDGRFVDVPRSQILSTVRDSMVAAADKFARLAATDFEENLDHVSPTTRRLLREFAAGHPDAAALLTAHLAYGRRAPELAVRTLLDSKPGWLHAGGTGEGLAVVAQYARSHELPVLAVEALAAVVEENDAEKYRHTRTSGLLLLTEDRERAKQLLDEAQAMPDSAGDVRLAIGFLALDHPPISAVPITMAADLRSQLEAAVHDEVTVSFLARQAELRGEDDLSVQLHERALSLDPTSPGYMQRLAHALLRRANGPQAHADDATRAVELAAKAVEQLHEWAGPTEEALGTLLQAQLFAGRVSAALNSALPPPDGRATAAEAQRPRVQAVAAGAAYLLGRRDIVDAVLRNMPDGLDRDMVRLRTGTYMDADEARDAWLDIVARLDATRPEELLIAVLHNADYGIDESARLDPLVDLGMVRASLRDAIAVMARAAADLDTHLPELRVAAETENVAATKLLELLFAARRFEDVVAAADVAATRFSNPELQFFKIDALDALGRTSEVEAALNELLASTTLDPYNRRLTHRRLAGVASNQIVAAPDAATATRLLQKLERHAAACVEQSELAIDDQDVWRLAEARMRLGQADAAFTVLTDRDPAFTDPWHGRVWLNLALQQATLPTAAYARMLDLADQFADDAELSAHLLATLTLRTRDVEDEPASLQDNRPALPGDIRAAAFAALQKHIERHGEDSPIRVIEAPTTEALIAQMTDMMRRDDAPLIELTEMARQARLPIGVISSAIGRPYSSTFAQRPLGYYLSAPAIDEDDDADIQAARNAFDSDVVVDASALLVAGELGEYDKFRGRFRTLLIPTVSASDITRGRAELDGQSSSAGFVSYNAASDSIIASRLDVDEHLDTLERFAALERSAETPQRVADVSLDSIDQVNLPNSKAWLAPIALAKERDLTLWSDDLAQRRLARALGVPAFGTTTLQTLRTNVDIDRAADDAAINLVTAAKRAETARLTKARVVDIPVDSDLIIEVGREADWDDSVALVTIGRPGWWHMTPHPFNELQQILQHIEDGDQRDRWRYQAMAGVARLASDGEPSRTATLLAVVAMTPVPEDTTGPEKTARHFQAAGEIAQYRKAHQPSDYLAEAAALLASAGLLDDPAGTVTDIRSALEAPSQPEDPSTGTQT